MYLPLSSLGINYSSNFLLLYEKYKFNLNSWTKLPPQKIKIKESSYTIIMIEEYRYLTISCSGSIKSSRCGLVLLNLITKSWSLSTLRVQWGTSERFSTVPIKILQFHRNYSTHSLQWPLITTDLYFIVHGNNCFKIFVICCSSVQPILTFYIYQLNINFSFLKGKYRGSFFFRCVSW